MGGVNWGGRESTFIRLAIVCFPHRQMRNRTTTGGFVRTIDAIELAVLWCRRWESLHIIPAANHPALSLIGTFQLAFLVGVFQKTASGLRPRVEAGPVLR